VGIFVLSGHPLDWIVRFIFPDGWVAHFIFRPMGIVPVSFSPMGVAASLIYFAPSGRAEKGSLASCSENHSGDVFLTHF